MWGLQNTTAVHECRVRSDGECNERGSRVPSPANPPATRNFRVRLPICTVVDEMSDARWGEGGDATAAAKQALTACRDAPPEIPNYDVFAERIEARARWDAASGEEARARLAPAPHVPCSAPPRSALPA